MMEGSGSRSGPIHIMTDPDPGGPKTQGSYDKNEIQCCRFGRIIPVQDPTLKLHVDVKEKCRAEAEFLDKFYYLKNIAYWTVYFGRKV